MKLSQEKKYDVFRVSWYILLIGTLCDLKIAENASVGALTINIQLSSMAVIIYLLTFLYLKPRGFFNILISDKFNKNNIIILVLLAIVIYISSFFSLMKNFALITTTSRYTLYFLALIASIYYTRIFENASSFILKSFIYINIIVVIACYADYYIPWFNRILVDYFGRMEPKHFVMTLDNVIYMRPSGFITDVNLTAFSLGLSAYILLLNRNIYNKYFVYLFFIFSGFASGMLASRSAIIFVIFLVLFGLFIKQLSLKNVLIFMILFVCIQAFTPQTRARLNFFTKKNVKLEEMEYGRPLIWKACYLAMEISPVIGIGTGIFFKQSLILIKKVKGEITDEYFYKEISNPEHVNDAGINPHNIFFAIQIEHGIAGSFFFILFVIFNIIYLIKKRKLNSLSVLLTIIFVSSFSNYSPYYKYFLMICIIYYVNICCDLKIKGLKAEE